MFIRKSLFHIPCFLISTTCSCPFRHEKYRTQYRAMFVMNCTVKRDEVLRYKDQRGRKPRKRRRGQNTDAPADQATASTPAMAMGSEEVYHPVNCSECSTEVAVFDKDEVYHFFNILASHCWDELSLEGSGSAALRERLIRWTSDKLWGFLDLITLK